MGRTAAFGMSGKCPAIGMPKAVILLRKGSCFCEREPEQAIMPSFDDQHAFFRDVPGISSGRFLFGLHKNFGGKNFD